MLKNPRIRSYRWHGSLRPRSSHLLQFPRVGNPENGGLVCGKILNNPLLRFQAEVGPDSIGGRGRYPVAGIKQNPNLRGNRVESAREYYQGSDSSSLIMVGSLHPLHDLRFSTDIEVVSASFNAGSDDRVTV